MSFARTVILVAGGAVAVGACVALSVVAFGRLMKKDDLAYRAALARRVAQAISDKTGIAVAELLPAVEGVLSSGTKGAVIPDVVLRIELHFNRDGDDVTENLYIAYAGDGKAVVNQRSCKLAWDRTPPFIRKRFFIEGTHEIRLLLYGKAGIET